MADGDVTKDDGYTLAAHQWLVACAKLMGASSRPPLIIPEIRDSLANLLRMNAQSTRSHRDMLQLANDAWQSKRDEQVAEANKRTYAAENRAANESAAYKVVEETLADVVKELVFAGHPDDGDPAVAVMRLRDERDFAKVKLGLLEDLVREAYVVGGPSCGQDHYVIAKGSWQRLGAAVVPKPRWSCTCTHAPEQHGIDFGCVATDHFGKPCTCITWRKP